MKKQKISIIVAIAGEKRVIGKKGGMPWHIPEELKRFREIPMGHPIIMGRKTHESIGRVLPERTNIVITRNLSYKPEGVIVAHSLDEALKVANRLPSSHPERSEGSNEIFVIGGGEIYKQALPIADKLYLTVIDTEIEGDTFFPDYSEFKTIVWQSDEQESDGFKYRFLELER